MQKSNVFHKRYPAFTLVELLVVVSIIALLISILLPSLRKARENAKCVKCMAHLSGFGRGFFTYATANDDYFCSGSFDPDVDRDRDGPVDKVGWVADLVNGGYGRPGEALCPSNLAKVNQKLGTGNNSGSFGAVYSNGDSYATWELIDGRIKRGYNTNYTQAWYMARTQMRSDTDDVNVKKIGSTCGPLRLNTMLKVSGSRIPLLGDGGLESEDEYLGKHNLGKQTIKSMSDGPFGGPFGPQDYSDFGPAHGFGKRLHGKKSSVRDTANILFADGHVGRFVDKVRDGEFSLGRDASGNLVQQDVDSQVFDGVITLGRRSKSDFLPK